MNKAPLIENLLELIEKNQFQKINKLLISNYKKSSVEGSYLNLKNTAELPLDLKICGNHFQEKRNGYNLLESKMATTTAQGVSVTNNKDGTWTLNGTATEDTTFRLDQSTQVATDNLKSYSAGDYTLFLGNWKAGLRLYVTRYPSYAWEMRLMDSSIQNGKLQGNNDYFIYLFITSGMTFNNYIVKPMLVEGTYTIDTIPIFEQYGAMPSLDYPSEVEGVTENVENKIQNKNYYNINDKIVSHFGSELKIDNEDWITVDVDNTNGIGTKFIDFWAKTSAMLKPNKNYYVVLEIKELNGKYLEIRPIDNYGNISQFDGVFNVYSQDLKAGDVLIKKIKTLSDFSKAVTLNRSYISLNAGLKASATFRISILAEEVTTSNFIYTPYKKQIYKLTLDDKFLYGEDHARDYFDVKIDENLYNCTGYKKIIELKLIKNWKQYVFNGEENIIYDTINNLFNTTVIKNTAYDDTTIPIVYSNYMLGIANDDWKSTRNNGRDDFIFLAARGQLYFNCSTYKDINTLKLKLQELSASENPFYIVYRLKNPEEEIITDVKLIEQIENMINNAQSYVGETNISSDAFLKIDFYKDKVLELEERLEKLENK